MPLYQGCTLSGARCLSRSEQYEYEDDDEYEYEGISDGEDFEQFYEDEQPARSR